MVRFNAFRVTKLISRPSLFSEKVLVAGSPKLRLRSFVKVVARKSINVIFSFLPFVQPFSPSVSQPPVFITLVVLSPVRPRPSVRSSVCTGFGPRGLARSLSHPKLHVQFHLQDETLT